MSEKERERESTFYSQWITRKNCSVCRLCPFIFSLLMLDGCFWWCNGLQVDASSSLSPPSEIFFLYFTSSFSPESIVHTWTSSSSCWGRERERGRESILCQSIRRIKAFTPVNNVHTVNGLMGLMVSSPFKWLFMYTTRTKLEPPNVQVALVTPTALNLLFTLRQGSVTGSTKSSS